jgi:hypothetical protein
MYFVCELGRILVFWKRYIYKDNIQPVYTLKGLVFGENVNCFSGLKLATAGSVPDNRDSTQYFEAI